MSSAAADRLPATRPPLVVACLKLVDSRPDVDPLSAAVRTDARSAGPSPADEAALEWALRLGRAWGLATVAVSAGGPAADPMLRDALAAGATGAWRVDVDADAPSADVAAAVAEALRPHPALVVCGAWSLDRGSGAFPAFLTRRGHQLRTRFPVGASIRGARATLPEIYAICQPSVTEPDTPTF